MAEQESRGKGLLCAHAPLKTVTMWKRETKPQINISE